MLIPAGDITGVVLCGGEGRRMGGVEKPLLDLHGKPLVAHALERLVPQVGRVIISANRELDAYRQFGHDVVSDVEFGLGPLGGLLSVVPQVNTPWLFCCPGDSPRLAEDIVARLGGACTGAAGGAYPHDGSRAHYLCLLVRTPTCSTLKSYLDSGLRSVHGWLGMHDTAEVSVPELRETFVNVNTPDELLQIR